MPTHAAGWQCHEIVPVHGLLAAAAPVLLEVVENGGSFVVVAGVFVVFLLDVVLAAALVDAPELSLLREESFLFLLGLGSLFLLLLLLKVYLANQLLLLYSLMSWITTFLASSFFRPS